MLYWLLRAVARVLLRSYYADVHVLGHHHLSTGSPIVVVANHPNALVDAMLVATTLEQKVFITARATLFDSRPLSTLLRRLGVIPLRRNQDIPSGSHASGLATRNDASRAQLVEVLQRHNAVLIFPEGVSDDRLHLAPLRSGAARIALRAHDFGVERLRILPLGLVYEAKERLHSRVLVCIGASVSVDAWVSDNPTKSPAALTRELTLRLDQASLGYASGSRAADAIAFVAAIGVSRSVATLAGETDGHHEEIDIDEAAHSMRYASVELRTRIQNFIRNASALTVGLRSRGLDGRTKHLEPRLGVRTAHALLRDLSLAILAFPVALLGRLFTLTLLRVANALALQSLRHDKSRDQPAMRTILIVLALLPTSFIFMVAILAPWLGGSRTVWLLGLLLVGFAVQAWYHDGIVNAVRRLPGYLSASTEGRQATLVSAAQALRSEARGIASALEAEQKMS